MAKLNKKNYNTTDLNPETTFERHVFHRDQFAHYLRWTHILKEAKIGDIVCDFGCGNGNLLEVLYRNRFKADRYVGIDIREKTIEAAKEKFSMVDWAEFHAEDLVLNTQGLDFTSIKANKVCSFEVIEHVGKQNALKFLENFKSCGTSDATYYLSTPNYDEHVGAAGNHTYDSGDGRGVVPQEFSHDELKEVIEHAGFEIVKKFGTFASVRDYKDEMNAWQTEMFNALKEYYDANLISNLMAPLFPEKSRNILWVLKRK